MYYHHIYCTDITYQHFHFHVDPVHELIVQIFTILIKLLQWTDSSSVFGAIAEQFHPIPRWFLCKVMCQVGIMHGHVVVWYIVAVWVCEVECWSRCISSKTEASNLKIDKRFTCYFLTHKLISSDFLLFSCPYKMSE